MLSWQVWLIIAGFCFILEIATVGFLIFWLGVAALITCLLSLFISNIVVQMAIFTILSAILIAFTRQFANKLNKNDTSVTNANSIIGKEGIVTKEIINNGIGQVKVSGDIWSAISEDSNVSIPVESTVKVIKIDGVKLVIKPITIKTIKKEEQSVN